MKLCRHNKGLAVLFFSSALASSVLLSACGETTTKLSDTYEDIDMLATNSSSIELEGLSKTITKSINVHGQDFKLNIKYNADAKVWRITSDKKITMEICTEGLSEDKEVFIDNIHTDTSIVSTYQNITGIIQDSMDDRVHNSLMLGFPISDNNSYFGINEIEGQNESFTNVYYSENNVSTSTERRTEEGYLSSGVYANKIDSIIDLLIRNKKTGEITSVSVSDELLVEINNRINYSDGSYYIYDRNGGYIEYDSDGKVKKDNTKKL